ncbi:HAD-IB family hydrolase [Gordonia iterans]|uniref:HAD-IB family hydrolase n=1 Tax=Gordonia iterans TaxID=1004901 RepID=A0A2S0KCH6_9ACTN|nr:HAD-IB family hydrolase [Gordonia iterans]AVL99392.1 HAD-IB family hydrolase [Gordonia iterans]
MAQTPPTRSAAFFDLDKTVIARSSALAFTRQFYDGGLLTKRGMLRSAIAQLQFLLTSDHTDQVEKMRRHVTEMCAGWEAATVRSIVSETLDDVVRPVIFAEAAALIAEHKAAGRDIILISASGIEMVEPIGELLGADTVRATVMTVVDGRYSGEIEFYCYGDQKAIAMRELAEAHGYDLAECYAYSDSSTDIPMLEAAGHRAVVNPDKALRAYATQLDWEILDFPNPAPLVDWSDPATRGWTAAAAAGVGVVAAVAVAAGLSALRHHRGDGPPSGGRHAAA